jgi:hypothetical protein
MLYPATHGALTPLWAGTSLETKDFNGKVASSSTSLSALYSILLLQVSYSLGQVRWAPSRYTRSKAGQGTLGMAGRAGSRCLMVHVCYCRFVFPFSRSLYAVLSHRSHLRTFIPLAPNHCELGRWHLSSNCKTEHRCLGKVAHQRPPGYSRTRRWNQPMDVLSSKCYAIMECRSFLRIWCSACTKT